jgi:hypothetical protein
LYPAVPTKINKNANPPILTIAAMLIPYLSPNIKNT